MNDNDQFDDILDEALSEYREAEPLAGLDDRVLQRLRLQPDRRPTKWWKWGAVAACAALVLAAIWIGVGSHRVRISPLNQSAAQQQAVPNPKGMRAGDETNANQPQHPQQAIASMHAPINGNKAQTSHHGSQERVARVRPTNIGGPDAPQFPSPTPLTPEEHALLALASTNPDALLNQPDRSRDLEIAPITIKPLAGSDAPAQENSNE